jgi:uncharacterized protein (TIGR02996 family)
MSATLRYDIGQQLGMAIQISYPSLFAALKMEPMSRWGGIGNPRWHGYTFALKLPADIETLYMLIGSLEEIGDNIFHNGTVANSCRLLQKKLSISVGLPWECFIDQPHPDEQAFLDCLNEEPGRLDTWGAYADWLQEHDDPRGTLISAWMNPKKAMKVKYGLPLMADPEKRRRMEGFQ